MPLENRFAFYPRYAWEIVSKHVGLARLYWQYRRILKRVERDRAPYTDIAMTPVQDSEFDELDLYTATKASQFAVVKLRRHKATRALTDA